MCHLRKRKVKSIREVLQAFNDNDRKPLIIDDVDSQYGTGFEGYNEEEVVEEASILFDSGSKAVIVAPLQAELV